MCNQRCYIVPPHLLQAIADSSSNPDNVREAAKASLESREKVSFARKELFTALTQPRGYTQGAGQQPFNQQRQHFVPESMLDHIANSPDVDEATRTRAKRDLEHLQGVIARVKLVQSGKSLHPGRTMKKLTSTSGNEEEVQSLVAQGHKDSPKDTPYRAVYDAQHANSEGRLPGKLIRAEGQKAVKDKAVNEAFDNVGAVLKFYKEKFQWKSIDNKNADVISSVHFGEAYENACKCN